MTGPEGPSDVITRYFGAAAGEDWQSVVRHLELAAESAFAFIVLLVPDNAAARILATELRHLVEGAGKRLEQWEPATPEDLSALAAHLLTSPLAEHTGAIWIAAVIPQAHREHPFWARAWVELVARLNERRDVLRDHLKRPLVFVGAPDLKEILRETAPDLWSVRTLVVELGAAVVKAQEGRPSPEAAEEQSTGVLTTPAFLRLKAATASVFVTGETEPVATACLVTPVYAVTVAHVFLRDGVGPETARGQPMRLRFADGEAQATIERIDPENDCALLRLGLPYPHSDPLPLGGIGVDGDVWQAYGFVEGGAGLFLEGQIIEAHRSDASPPNGDALILHADGFLSEGHGAFSGSPVLVDGDLAGIITGSSNRRTLVACPAQALQNLLLQVQRAKGTWTWMPPPGKYHPAVLIHRIGDEKAAEESLDRGLPVVIQGPRGFGKTTFLRQITERFLAEVPDAAAATIDLSALPEEALANPRLLFNLIALEIANALALPEGLLIETTMKPYSRPPAERLNTFIVRHVLPRVTTGLLLAFDGVDVFLTASGRHEFFHLLRRWTTAQETSHLRILLTVAGPLEYLDDAHEELSSVSKSAQRVVLRDFEPREIRELVLRYRLFMSDSELQWLQEWIGGHPYLVALTLYEMARRYERFYDLLPEIRQDGGIYNGHLGQLRDWLNARPELRRIVSALAHGQAPSIDPGDEYDLLAMGLIEQPVPGTSTLRLRNRLYQVWFQKQLPP